MNVACRGKDDALDGADGADGVDHILNADGVGVVVGQRGAVEVAAGGEVDDMAGAEVTESFDEGVAIADVALAE